MACAAHGCDRTAGKGSTFCPAHAKRVQRRAPLAPPVRPARTSWGVLVDAALTYADAPGEDDDAYSRAAHNLRRAAAAYGRKGKG